MIKVFETGGKIRDEFLGLKNKDIDYAVETESYEAMRDYILEIGGEIFLETPEFVTIRARVGKIAADYVLCRKDGEYKDGRHPKRVEIGTIYDDLARRDFTMNAIAKDQDGNYLDPHRGIEDIHNRYICCVGRSIDRIQEDYLRLLRAIRFSITKNMFISDDIYWMFDSDIIIDQFRAALPADRIRDELFKMFAWNTNQSIEFFGEHPKFREACFSSGIWLRPTSEKP